MDHRLQEVDTKKIDNLVFTFEPWTACASGADAQDFIDTMRLDNDRMTLRRDQIDLLNLAPFLPKIVLHDFVLSDTGELEDILVRFLGGNNSAYFGEASGQSVGSHYTIETADRSFLVSRRMCETRTIQRSLSKAKTPRGETIVTEALWIPLCDDDDRVCGSLLYIDLTIAPGSI